MPKNFNQEGFKQIFDICKKQLLDLGYTEINENKYTLEFNTRIKNVLGRCTKRGNNYIIELNKTYATIEGIEKVMETIMHELIHSTKNCMNHGQPFKMVATRVNNAYGYDVSRTTSTSNEYKKAVGNDTKTRLLKRIYKIQCENCGKVYSYQKKSKNYTAIANGSKNYNCSCGCNNFKVV